MPADIYPPFTSGNINSLQKVRDVSPAIAFLAPRFAQILLLSARVAPAPFQNAFGIAEQGATPITLGVRTVTNFKYEWFEDAIKTVTATVSNGGNPVANNATVIPVVDASVFQINDLVDVVSTLEIMMVTAVNTATNQITVTRAWGTTAAAQIADSSTLLIIGNAFSEAGTYQLSPQRLTVQHYNYIQDTRHAFAGTYVLDHHEWYGGDQRGYMRSKYLVDHQRAMESSLLWGQMQDSVSGLSDASPKKSTQGLLDRLTSNNLNVGGILTKQVWNSWLRDLFEYGSDEKVIMCSKVVAGAINNFAGDNNTPPISQIFVMNNARSFGLNVMSYQTKFGIVHLVMHGLLNATNGFSGYAIGIDPMHIQLCKVRNGFFMNLREDTVQDGAHRWVDEYASYFGLQYTNPENGGVLSGVTG